MVPAAILSVTSFLSWNQFLLSFIVVVLLERSLVHLYFVLVIDLKLLFIRYVFHDLDKHINEVLLTQNLLPLQYCHLCVLYVQLSVYESVIAELFKL